MESDLYENICKAKIKESIHSATRIILKNPKEPDCEPLIHTFIAVCSYIGSFISIYDIRLMIDVCHDIQYMIEDEKIIMKNIYILITKLCIICDIYIKNPVTKTGTSNVKLLRSKIIDIFTLNDKYKLSDNGISLFEALLPPADSESFALAVQIITGYVHCIKELETFSTDNHADKIEDLANKIRKSFDYIIRKKYIFETKFYKSDNDAVWFLWGMISLLYKDHDMDLFYELFNYGYIKKNKNMRIGLLWAAGILMVWIKKRDIGRGWSSKEVQVIKKIEEISQELYIDTKKALIESGEVENNSNKLNEECKIKGLEYINNVRHILQPETDECSVAQTSEDLPVKYIKYRKQFYLTS
jgi:hypothetical protein